MTFDQLAGRVRALDERAVDLSDPASPRLLAGRRCRVVGIDGLSGSGKSSFAARLAGELSCPVLAVDDLVPGWDAIAESISLLAEWVLRPLAAGQPARWQQYDWLAGRPGAWVDLDPPDFLVVEGCCIGLEPAASLFSFLIWIDSPARERWRRLELRPDWATYAPFAERWTRQETALQAAADTPARADLVVDNSARRGDGRWPDEFTGRPHPGLRG